MLSILYKLFLKHILSNFRVILLVIAIPLTLYVLASCSHQLQGPRFAAPPQVLVIECNDKALVV